MVERRVRLDNRIGEREVDTLSEGGRRKTRRW